MSSKKCQNPFSPQQKQILKYLIAGLDNRKIVAKTGLSETELKKRRDQSRKNELNRFVFCFFGISFSFYKRNVFLLSVNRVKIKWKKGRIPLFFLFFH